MEFTKYGAEWVLLDISGVSNEDGDRTKMWGICSGCDQPRSGVPHRGIWEESWPTW